MNIFCIYIMTDGEKVSNLGSSALGTSTAQGYFSKIVAN